MLTVTEIAKKNEVNAGTLRRYHKQYGNIEKAVFICQMKRNERNTLVNGKIAIDDYAIILKMKPHELRRLLAEGKTIEELIKETNEKAKTNNGGEQKGEKILSIDGRKSLYQYCIDNSLNYSCIYYMMVQYGRNVEEATQAYIENGQQIPKAWIYERYGILLKHLMLKYKIDYSKIVKTMQKDEVNLEKAIEQYIIKKECKGKPVDDEWVCELYEVLTDENMKEEYDTYKKEFYVDDTEEEIIIASYERNVEIHRKLELYEIADTFKRGSFGEGKISKEEILIGYEVKPEEIEEIYLDLYGDYKEGVLKTTDEDIRGKEIREITKKWINMTEKERKEAVKRLEISKEEEESITTKSVEIAKMKQVVETSRLDDENLK